MTHPTRNETTVRELIRQELPDLVRDDGKIRDLVIEVGRERFADRDRTEGRIEQILDELRRDRERNDRKWEEQRAADRREWEAHLRKWEEQRAADKREREEQRAADRQEWKANIRKWEEQRAADKREREEQRAADRQEWKANIRKWEEQWAQDKQEREEQRAEDRREWEAHIQDNKRLSETVARLERTFGAIGARWGLDTERSFREALAGILEKSFGVAVVNVNEFDEEGIVFGYPDQVELDVVIYNGTLILIEIKSSFSKADIYIFERKVRFYERRHGRKAQRRIAISPMIDPRAREAGKQLGMELYADSADVPTQ